LLLKIERPLKIEKFLFDLFEDWRRTQRPRWNKQAERERARHRQQQEPRETNVQRRREV